MVSAVGVLTRLRDRSVDWRTGIVFGLVGVPAAWAGTLLNRVVPQPVLLLSFSALTLAIAVLLLVRSTPAPAPAHGTEGAGTAAATAELDALSDEELEARLMARLEEAR